MLKAKSFSSIQEKREYVRDTLIERGEWKPALEGQTTLSYVPEDVREDAETSALLQPGLPQEGLVSRPQEYYRLSDLPNIVRSKKTAADVLQSEVQVGRVAKSKSRKPSRKPIKVKPKKVCRACLQKFIPSHSKQLFCDKVCQESIGRGHDRLEQRLRALMILEYQSMKEDIKQEVQRQAGLIGANLMLQFEKRLQKIVRDTL